MDAGFKVDKWICLMIINSRDAVGPLSPQSQEINPRLVAVPAGEAECPQYPPELTLLPQYATEVRAKRFTAGQRFGLSSENVLAVAAKLGDRISVERSGKIS